MSGLTEIIGEVLETDESGEVDIIAKQVWAQIEDNPDLGTIIFPILRGAVETARREKNRALAREWVAETSRNIPKIQLPIPPKPNPWDTIAAAREGMAETLRRYIEQGEIQLGKRTIPMREVTAAILDEKIAMETSRLNGLYEQVQVYRQLKTYFNLGIGTLGELL